MPSGDGPVYPARLLQRELPLAGPQVDDVDVLVAAAVEVAHQLVLADVGADRELAPSAPASRCARVVGQPDELLLLTR